ncbi:MAG: hypothetical protein E7003_06895 [Eggerthellaceae bacterium]|nr:hypothetical protein [Eggerthellaceae bacterium]
MQYKLAYSFATEADRDYTSNVVKNYAYMKELNLGQAMRLYIEEGLNLRTEYARGFAVRMFSHNSSMMEIFESVFVDYAGGLYGKGVCDNGEPLVRLFHKVLHWENQKIVDGDASRSLGSDWRAICYLLEEKIKELEEEGKGNPGCRTKLIDLRVNLEHKRDFFEIVSRNEGDAVPALNFVTPLLSDWEYLKTSPYTYGILAEICRISKGRRDVVGLDVYFSQRISELRFELLRCIDDCASAWEE